MDTTTRILSSVAAALALTLPASNHPATRTTQPDVDGDASSGITHTAPNPGVQAAFEARSYRPGATGVLKLYGTAPVLELRLYHAAAGHSGPLQGAPVAPTRTLRNVASTVTVKLADWPSGLYYARVITPTRGVWYAPFVLRPSRLGLHHVLVVLPTNTWQAYNFEDGDSWYENPDVTTVDLTRPYIDGGVPPHYHGYDRGFLRWLALHHKQVDFVSDDDLDRLVSGAVLARDYTLVIFPGHEEYVDAHEFDATEQYRDLGGHLAFLSANDFFYKVVMHGNLMDGRWRWRDVGRPEATLVGAMYVDWNHDVFPNRPFIVTGVAQTPWLFTGTGLRDGSSFGNYGIEVDALAGSSPPATRVLATIPDIFGPGKTAEMTYYTTPSGAEVFSAGVMNFGGSALWPVVSTMIVDLWTKLAPASQPPPVIVADATSQARPQDPAVR